MGRVYVYGAQEEDLTTIGLVGALLPTKCEFNIKAGEFGELTLTHPLDPYGKWRALETDAILKCPVPVRICPAFKEDNSYQTVVWHYKVSRTASKDERTLYKGAKESNKKKVKTLSAGQALVSITQFNLTSERYKVTAKVGKKKYTGWISGAALDITQARSETIPGTSTGFEQAEASYAVKDQLFRIRTVTKSDDNGGSVDVVAMRLCYDLYGVPTNETETTRVNGKTVARRVLSEARLVNTGYTVYSDVSSEVVGVNLRDMSVIEALCSPDSGVAGIFGAQPVVDDYDIYMLAQAGMDRGVQIRYAKNLTGVSCEIDTTDMYEGILPVGESENGGSLYITAETALGEGYERRDRGDGTNSPVIIYKTGVYTPTHSVYTLKVSDAKVDKKNGVTAANARLRLVEEAKKAFDSGIASAKISLDVDFVLLGDTDDYAQYKHLDSLFVYDTVSIHHPKLGINVETLLTELTWDVLAERVTEAHFGELTDLTPTVSSSQISGLNGSKILVGSVTGAQLGDGAIKQDHLQIDSINADAIQAQAITTAKLAAGAVTAQKIDATSVAASLVDTDTMKAHYAEIEQGRIKDATIDWARITQQASIDSLITRDAISDRYYIEKLGVNSANIARLCVGAMLIKCADDGKYYSLNITKNSDGSMSYAPVEYTGEIDDDGHMSADGSKIVSSEELPYDDLFAAHADITDALIATLSVGFLKATDIFAGSVRTSQIWADGGTLDIGTIDDLGNKLKDLITLDEQRGTLFHDATNAASGVRITRGSTVDIEVQNQTYSRFGGKYIRLGEFEIRDSADGSLVFKPWEG